MKKHLLAIALIACFGPVALPQSGRANPAVLGAVGCAASGICGAIVGTAIVAGVAYYVIQGASGRRSRVYASGFQIHRQPIVRPSRMLTDPEAREEADSDYIWAADDAQAEQMCRRYAAKIGARYDGIRPGNEWRNNWGKKRYSCNFTRFVE